MKNIKKIIKLFYILDLEKEENWLRSMANKGWYFQKVDFLGIYTFVKGPCRDIIYKIDFNKKIEDIEEYSALFNQCGWKSIYRKGLFNYFQYTGDVSNYTIEMTTYNDEQLAWLRKKLIIILMAYGINFVCLYSLFSLQRTFYNNIIQSVKLIMICIIFLSIELIWIVNSYIILKKKIKEKQYKDYYERNHFKKASSVVSLFIFPILVSVLVFATFTSIYTVGGSEKSIKHKILQSDKVSLYPMKKINYITVHDFKNIRACLYGNNERIGMITLDKVFLNRYKVTNNFSGDLPSNQCVMNLKLNLDNNSYLAVYGKDEKQEIKKIALIYYDGTKDEYTKDTFIRINNCFYLLQKIDKTFSKIKIYDKENLDVTDKYIK